MNVRVAMFIIIQWFEWWLLLAYRNFIYYFLLVSVYTGANEILQFIEHSALRIFLSAKLALYKTQLFVHRVTIPV